MTLLRMVHFSFELKVYTSRPMVRFSSVSPLKLIVDSHFVGSNFSCDRDVAVHGRGNRTHIPE